MSPRRTVILRSPAGSVLIQIEDPESPADLQPVRPTGQHRGVRCRNLPPFATVPVIPLGKAPQIVTSLHHMIVGMINSLSPRSCWSRRLESRSAR